MSSSAESLRMEALDFLEVLDSAAEPAFDHIVKLASDIFQTPISLISLVDTDRQWFKSCIGLDVSGTSRDIAFCDYTIRQSGVMVVPDASLDPRFCINPLVTGEPHIRFYAGAPITSGGQRIGTLCIIDRVARLNFSLEQQKILQGLADTTAHLFTLRKEAILTTKALRRHEETQRKLEMMEEVAGVGYWHVDLKSQKISWSKGVFAIHGVSPDGYMPNIETAIEWYHPDDRNTVSECLSHTISTGEEFAFELRLVRQCGEVRKVYSRGKVSYDQAGAPASIFGIFSDITERHKAQQLIEQSEARYRLLADTSHDMIVLFDVEGVFEYLSPSIERIMGYEADEMVGKKVQDFIVDEDLIFVKSALQNYVFKKDYEVPFRLEWRAYCKNGQIIHLEANSTPIVDAQNGRILKFQGVVRDITDRKRIEAELSIATQKVVSSEARMRLLTENLPGIVGYWNTDLICTFANNAHYDWFGVHASDMPGRMLVDFIDTAGLALDKETITNILKGCKHTAEQVVVTSEGRTSNALAQYVPDRDQDGRMRGFYVLITDVSELKQKEIALAHANEQLVIARKEAEAGAEIKSQFLTTMSHEIRTPLTTIIGYSNLLSEATDLTTETSGYVNRVKKAGKTLLSLINNVLDVSQLEAGQVKLDPQANNVQSLVSDLLDQFRLPGRNQTVDLSLDYDEELPVWQLIDDTRLSQILINLIGNACKFTESGSVVVNAQAVERDKGPFMRVEVVDTGPGLTAAQTDALFQRFHQADSTISRKHGGSGLGLAICSEIVHLMDGKIGVNSTLGKGSTFWFELPINLAVPLYVDDAFEQVEFDIHDRKVLLVDDHTVNRQLVRALILPYSAQVIEATDGDEAVALCGREKFDLIFMDVQMPGKDGVIATKEIKAAGRLNGETPVIALTALSKSRRSPRQDLDVFDHVLAKPIDPIKFNNALRLIPSPRSSRQLRK